MADFVLMNVSKRQNNNVHRVGRCAALSGSVFNTSKTLHALGVQRLNAFTPLACNAAIAK